MKQQDLPRRTFLHRGAATLSASSALALLPGSIRNAFAVDAAVETGTIQDVKHIVILMQENRSFSHYFGTMRGVRGFGDRFPIPLASGKDVWWQSDGNREITPYHMNVDKTRALLIPSTPHGFGDSQAAWNQGKSGQWPRFKTEYSMGYYARKDIPFQFSLAEAFTLCDGYHCSVTTGTDPNRIVFWSGSNYNPVLAQGGVNCTDSDGEPNNLRCAILGGSMPTPGYTYQGSSFLWKTLPELLEAAGISWRIYQDPNDNMTGLTHGCLAFDSFRKATVTSGSKLYENGMKKWTVADLKAHVVAGTLPAVSWILPSAALSEHPNADCSPAKAGNYVSTILGALTANPKVWAKTVFFYTFDENDGLFDHLPPPAVPSYNVDGTLAGKATLPLAGEYFSDPNRRYLIAADTISGTLRPWGLGARVPMYVVSPWSKGGWVNSQVFDHTSMAMFLEKRFNIRVDAISPWHRAVCGDLTSCFDFVSPNDIAFPVLPDMSGYAAIEAAQRTLPNPVAPAVPAALYQEPGAKYSRALPYELHTSARIDASGLVQLVFANTGTQGAVFHVYDKRHLDRIPRRYTVEAGKQLSDYWNPAATDGGEYDLRVYSTNGFIRFFSGNSIAYASSGFQPEVQVCYELVQGDIYVKVNNCGTEPGRVTVRSEVNQRDGPWMMGVDAGGTATMRRSLTDTGQWYDLTVTAPNFTRRFSGRVENGRHGVSDPYMALHLAGNAP